MQPWEIRRWNISDVEQVFGLCGQRQQTCTAFSQPLQAPSVFDTWQGLAASEAMSAGDAHRADIDAHGNEVAQVGNVAQRAVSEMQDIIDRLNRVEADITGDHMWLNEQSGRVIDPEESMPPALAPTMESIQRAEERALRKKQYQSVVDQIGRDADQADRDLAMAVEGATGQIPLDQVGLSTGPADYPSGGFPGLTAGQIGAQDQNSLTGTTRYIPMRLPSGWKDNPQAPTTSLGQEYGNTVKFGPNTPGVLGGSVSTLQPKGGGTPDKDNLQIPYLDPKEIPDGFPREGADDGSARDGGGITLDYDEGTRLRADGATPTDLHETTVNGKTYLAVHYNYDYSAANTKVFGANGIDLPTDNAEHWHRISEHQIQVLHDEYDIPVPKP